MIIIKLFFGGGFIATYCSMIDQIKILMQLFGDVENRKVMDGTELEENGM